MNRLEVLGVVKAGFTILESPYLQDKVQTRFPRSKAKRIRKKWKKQDKNYSYAPSKQIYIAGGEIMCHPVIAKKIRDKIARENDLQENK
jgi:hypothetical protein